MKKQSALTDTDLNDLIQRCLKRDVVAQKRLYDAFTRQRCWLYVSDIWATVMRGWMSCRTDL
jgi:hypothetical protein